MKKFSLLIAVLVLATNFFGCREKEPDQEILDAVKKNVAAMNDEDLEAYMLTIHEDSPLYQATRENLVQVFADLDLRIELRDAQVVEKSKDKDTAGVRYVQVVRDAGPRRPGPAKKQIGYYVMKKSGKAWKIYDSQVIEEFPL